MDALEETDALYVVDISDLSFDDASRVGQLVGQLSDICESSGFFYLKESIL
jgi:isopenicillin N synthase-like dioxygenase